MMSTKMPQIDSLVESMGNTEYISNPDLSKGYYHGTEDRVKTAFASQPGKFQFTKMPFGLKGHHTLDAKVREEWHWRMQR